MTALSETEMADLLLIPFLPGLHELYQKKIEAKSIALDTIFTRSAHSIGHHIIDHHSATYQQVRMSLFEKKAGNVITGLNGKHQLVAAIEFERDRERRFNVTKTFAFGKRAPGGSRYADATLEFMRAADLAIRYFDDTQRMRKFDFAVGGWSINQYGTEIDLQAMGREFDLVP